ncbi:MAG TPA: hypothetical protein VFJ29_01505, partial [Candidatus Kapabacteria bacterium]|nr:hypothetical protein [Candidatus Kapabacteria bacterium]
MSNKITMVRIAAVGLCCVIFVAISCKKSSDSSNPVNNNSGGQGIGANGGTVTSSDGNVQLVIPPGALSSTQSIAIQQTNSNACPQGVGTGYSFTPNGLAFNLPVVLTLHYSDSALAGGNAELLGVAYQDDNGNWFGVTGGAVDTAAKTITVPISHFSNWSEYESYVMLPVNNPITVLTSGTLNFYVANTGAPVSNPSGNPTQLAPLGQNIIPNAWMVNGVVGGTSGTGTIGAGLQKQGIYTAPASMPSPNNVSVSAQITLPNLSSVILQTTVNILAQNWKLERTVIRTYDCGSATPYSYTLTSGGDITFQLGSTYQITGVGSFSDSPNYGLADTAVCSPFSSTYNQHTFTLGKNMNITSLSGAYNTSLNAIVPNINATETDNIGIHIWGVINGQTVTLQNSPVASGGSLNGPVYFFLDPVKGERSGNTVTVKVTTTQT